MKNYQSAPWTTFAALVAGFSLSGCSEYMDRKDTIAFNAGEAVQTSIVAHVTDPWPAHSRVKDIAFSGERMARATRCYELGPRQNTASGTAAGAGAVTLNVNASSNASGDQASGSASSTQC